MSNTWSWNVVLALDRGTAEEQVRRALRCAAARGYGSRHAETGQIRGMRYDGMEELFFDSDAAVATTLGGEGGSVTLWNGDVDLSLSAGPAEGAQLLSSPPWPIECLSLSIFGNWRLTQPGKLTLADDVQAIFVDLCTQVGSPYAYATDEYVFESIMLALDLPPAGWWPLLAQLPALARADRLPPLLFWRQYFSSAYAQRLPLQRFAAFGGVLQSVADGVLVSFSNYPWEVESRTLAAINKAWRRDLRQQPSNG